MLRSRFLALSAQASWRLPSRCRRVYPFRMFQSRSYCRSSEKSSSRRDINQIPSGEPVASQSWKDHIVAPIAILAIAGAGLYLHYNDEKRATPLGSNKDVAITKNRPAIGGAFQLIDTKNRLVTESDLLGNWVLMYFGYTSSPDICPDELQKMAKVIQLLESKNNLKITPVFITIDPQRDSPSQLRAYLGEFDPRIMGLTGPISAIRQIAHEYRVFFKKVDEESREDYLVESSNNMYLLDPNMEMVKYFGLEYDATQLAEGILNEVKKSTPK